MTETVRALRQFATLLGTELACQFRGRKYQFGAADLFTLTAKHDS